MKSAVSPLVACVLLLAACGGSGERSRDGGDLDAGAPDAGTAVPQALEVWQYELTRTGASDNFASQTALVGPPQFVIGEELFDHRVVGDVALHPRGLPAEAFGEVASTADGETFHAQSVAPSGSPNDVGQPIGLLTDLTVARRLRRTADQASLRVAITGLLLDLIDTGTFRPTGAQCPWDVQNVDEDDCADSMVSEMQLTIDAFRVAPDDALIPVHHLGAHARLNGWHGHWAFHAGTDGDSDAFVWDEFTFEFIPDFGDDSDPFARAIVRLPPSSDPAAPPPPLKLSVPLGGVSVDDDVDVYVHVLARSFNRKQFESFAGAFFWDPESLQGLQLETDGLVVEQAATPLEQRAPPPPDSTALTCAGGPDPAAGLLQFGAATVRAFEGAGAIALIPVTRSGGARGAVSALFQAADDTAVAGIDYQTSAGLVRFADGEEGTRFVPVQILDNTTVDGARSARLSLTGPGGCAALGPQDTAALEILDDDGRQ